MNHVRFTARFREEMVNNTSRGNINNKMAILEGTVYLRYSHYIRHVWYYCHTVF